MPTGTFRLGCADIHDFKWSRPLETTGVDSGDRTSYYAILNAEGMMVEEGCFRAKCTVSLTVRGTDCSARLSRQTNTIN
jgi:hypothetical protein